MKKIKRDKHFFVIFGKKYGCICIEILMPSRKYKLHNVFVYQFHVLVSPILVRQHFNNSTRAKNLT